MSFPIKGTKRRHKVYFVSRAMAASPSQKTSSKSSGLEGLLYRSGSFQQPQPTSGFIEELPPDAGQSSERLWEEISNPITMSATAIIPTLFRSLPPIRDSLATETSELQDETVEQVFPYLSGTSGDFTSYNHHGIPHLDRARHIRFLHKSLAPLPEQYVGADAARPWFFYWSICALCTLGVDVSPYRERLISTVRLMQNRTGGFGGGQGQMSHLAPTYAVVLALSMVGGEQALKVIDRRAMWEWLGAVKQPDGGFQMSVGGEEDVRGAYCATTIISLLNLPLDLSENSPAWSREMTSLLSGLPGWISRCQTFEGGISARPDAEAHGGYAFCALACLCILDDPHVIIPKTLDLPGLISWLSARQYAPEGGFAGRTNKLVDGCYSHWVGGCWPLVAAALKNDTSLYSHEALIRYIFCACQDTSRRGGLRDKPGKLADAYHTCYVLAGLSSAQHLWTYKAPTTSTTVLNGAYNWSVSTAVPGEQIFDEQDRVGTLHPVFVIPDGVAERTRSYFEKIDGL